MAINPELITTIRVDQLPNDPITLTSLLAHQVGTELKQDSIQSLVDLVATAVGVSGGVGYIALSVTDGQQLPDVPLDPSFFLCGAGTFLNVNGYPDVICTENLNAVMSLSDHWELAVEIPINPLSGTVQTVTGSAVDNTDPLNPVINSTGGATPTLQEVTTEGANTNVNTIWESPTDPTNIYIEINTTDNSILFWDKNIDAVNAVGVYVAQGNLITTTAGSVSFGENTGGIFQQYVMSNGQNMLFGFRELPIYDVAKQPTYVLNPDKLTAEYVLATLDDITGGGATDLAYTPSPTNGIVTSSTGTDATLPLADATDAGLLQPADFTQLSTLATDLANINTDAVDKVTVKLALGISKGQAVYISSATGTNIIVSKASNSSEATSSKTLGLLATTGVTNDIVEVVTSGLLDGLDTSTATIGDPVWLGTSGNLIYGLASKPVAPAHLVYIGVVSRVSATVGEIFVRVQNGFELNEIHDVLITSVANNQVLNYDSASSLWKNKTLAKSDVGLGNVDNTSDANKPVSTATQTALDLRTRELLQDFTDYTTTAVLTEQIISNQAITANDMKINSWLNFIATLSRTGTTNATVAIYLNTTSNSLSGAVKIATATITSTQSLPCFKRDFSINASSVLRGVLFTANIVTDEIATQAQSTTTLTLGSGYYLITTVALNNTADTVTQRAINLKSSK